MNNDFYASDEDTFDDEQQQQPMASKKRKVDHSLNALQIEAMFESLKTYFDEQFKVLKIGDEKQSVLAVQIAELKELLSGNVAVLHAVKQLSIVTQLHQSLVNVLQCPVCLDVVKNPVLQCSKCSRYGCAQCLVAVVSANVNAIDPRKMDCPRQCGGKFYMLQWGDMEELVKNVHDLGKLVTDDGFVHV